MRAKISLFGLFAQQARILSCLLLSRLLESGSGGFSQF
jgi:hypothetical protein